MENTVKASKLYVNLQRKGIKSIFFPFQRKSTNMPTQSGGKSIVSGVIDKKVLALNNDNLNSINTTQELKSKKSNIRF